MKSILDREISYETPKWKRLTLPENLFPQSVEAVSETLSIEGNGIEIKPFEIFHEKWFSTKEHKKNLGQPFESYVNQENNHGYVVESKSRDENAQVKIEYKLSEDKPVLVDNNLFIAHEGAYLTVILNYQSSGDLTQSDSAQNSTVESDPTEIVPVLAQHYGNTRVIAKRGSHVKVIKIQNLGVQDYNFDQNFSVVEEGAVLELIDIQFGSQINAVSYESHLQGRHSNADLQSLYFGEDQSQLDLSFTMRHFGAKSESKILSKGALSGQSKKTFRGNLIFETGSAQSVGREKEVVTLLDEKVKSDSIPALMCSEDDVIGEHAASVGQLDQDKIFYLMSRGLSLEAAKKLVIKASFEEVLSTISDETLKADIEASLDRRLS